jgi:transposase
VRNRSVGIRAWARMLGLEKTVLEAVELDEHDQVVISVRPDFRQRDRCPHCQRRCPGYDLGDGCRRWRASDLGTTFCCLEADAPRVESRRHGVVVAAVPWARHDAGFTRSFEDQTVRHEAPLNRVGYRSPPPGCRNSSVKRGAV